MMRIHDIGYQVLIKPKFPIGLVYVSHLTYFHHIRLKTLSLSTVYGSSLMISKVIISSIFLSLLLPATSCAKGNDSQMTSLHKAPLQKAQLQQVVDTAYDKYKGLKDGKNADYIPILATVPSDLFGIVIVTRDGTIISKGDID